MPKSRKDVDASERKALMLRLPSKEEPAAQIARRAGVAESRLYPWRDAFLEGGARSLAGRGLDKAQERELQRLQRALAKRDQVIGERTIANRIKERRFRAMPLTPEGTDCSTLPEMRYVDCAPGSVPYSGLGNVQDSGNCANHLGSLAINATHHPERSRLNAQLRCAWRAWRKLRRDVALGSPFGEWYRLGQHGERTEPSELHLECRGSASWPVQAE